VTAPALIDQPVAGFYRRRLVKGGPWVEVEIWRGFGADPLTGEALERGWEWRATQAGESVPIWEVWPYCAGEPIEKAEFEYLRATRLYAAAHDRSLPEARPRERIDIRNMPAVLPPR
jgi:hypothetical protein